MTVHEVVAPRASPNAKSVAFWGYFFVDCYFASLLFSLPTLFPYLSRLPFQPAPPLSYRGQNVLGVIKTTANI